MVLQAGRPVAVFGTGAGRVSVRVNGAAAEADVSGPEWRVTLPAQPAGGPFTMSVTLGGEETLLRDVYFGDVYLLAGQSNMQFKLAESSTPQKEWTSHPLLRAFSLPRPEAGEPFTPEDGWQVCTRENAGRFSALGYHLNALCRGGRAVGLINCYQGASVIESWLPEDVAESPEFALPLSDKHIDHTWPDYAVWNRSGYLYRHMFSLVPPFSLGAVVWYQGESDTTKAEAAIYDRELVSLIRRWRADLEDPGLPFVVVQIADYEARDDEDWRALQAAQEAAVRDVEGAYLARSADVCERDSIHPASKDRLAARVADILRSVRRV